MEKEGSGFDMLYDRLLSSGRPAPVPSEGPDCVKVTIKRRIMKPEVIQFITQVDARYQLAQRERITLAALAQSEGMTARELATLLDVGSTDELASWFGRLLKVHLVQSTGRTQATRYFVDPELLRDSGITLPTTLKRIEPHRLQELVREDLRRYPHSKISEISDRIGPEVNRSQLKRALADLVKMGAVRMDGVRSGVRYQLATKT
jgi:ATP-dependent DNA helicase RecG